MGMNPNNMSNNNNNNSNALVPNMMGGGGPNNNMGGGGGGGITPNMMGGGGMNPMMSGGGMGMNSNMMGGGMGMNNMGMPNNNMNYNNMYNPMNNNTNNNNNLNNNYNNNMNNNNMNNNMNKMNSYSNSNSKVVSEKEKLGRTLFVRNIAYSCTEEEVIKLFGKCGEIKKTFSLLENRGISFITFYDLRHAERAKNEIQGTIISGRSIDIHYSIPKDESGVDENAGFIQVKNKLPINEIRNFFLSYGDIRDVSEFIKSDAIVVEFYDLRACEKAMNEAQGATLCDQKLELSYYTPKEVPAIIDGFDRDNNNNNRNRNNNRDNYNNNNNNNRNNNNNNNNRNRRDNNNNNDYDNNNDRKRNNYNNNNNNYNNNNNNRYDNFKGGAVRNVYQSDRTPDYRKRNDNNNNNNNNNNNDYNNNRNNNNNNNMNQNQYYNNNMNGMPNNLPMNNFNNMYDMNNNFPMNNMNPGMNPGGMMGNNNMNSMMPLANGGGMGMNNKPMMSGGMGMEMNFPLSDAPNQEFLADITQLAQTLPPFGKWNNNNNNNSNSNNNGNSPNTIATVVVSSQNTTSSEDNSGSHSTNGTTTGCINVNGDMFFNRCWMNNKSVLPLMATFIMQFVNPRTVVYTTTSLLVVLPAMLLLGNQPSVYPTIKNKYISLKISLIHMLHRASYPLVLGVGLYAVFRQRRPCLCNGVHIGSYYGMPSGDAMAGGILAAYLIDKAPFYPWIARISGVLLMICVCFERTILGFHTVGQVVTGTSIGFALHFYSTRVPQWVMFIDIVCQWILSAIALQLDKNLVYAPNDSNNLWVWFIWGVSYQVLVIFLLLRVGKSPFAGWDTLKKSFNNISKPDLNIQTDSEDHLLLYSITPSSDREESEERFKRRVVKDADILYTFIAFFAFFVVNFLSYCMQKWNWLVRTSDSTDGGTHM
eukprot:gene838-1045_t